MRKAWDARGPVLAVALASSFLLAGSLPQGSGEERRGEIRPAAAAGVPSTESVARQLPIPGSRSMPIDPAQEPSGVTLAAVRTSSRPVQAAPLLPTVRFQPALLVRIPSTLSITSRAGGGRHVGTMPARSKYLWTGTVAWVMERTDDGRYGKVPVPYTGARATGWISLKGLKTSSTPYEVRIDLSRRELVVLELGRVVYRTPTAIGGPSSPTPPGRYFVTDRVAFPPTGYYGSYAFGMSGIQTRLPAGWRGGNQLAIHGTNDPGSIGRAASAGCLRVSRAALAVLKPMLALGTPVIVEP